MGWKGEGTGFAGILSSPNQTRHLNMHGRLIRSQRTIVEKPTQL